MWYSFAHAMRIFVLGTGATGSLLAQLLERQGHTVWCGDRDPERGRRFLGKKSLIPIAKVNARNLRGIIRAARGAQLVVNASASVFNQIVMRAALHLRAHYVDLSSHLTKNPFKSEQFAYAKRFAEKNRLALINTGAAPGLTNLLAKRAAESFDEVTSVQIPCTKARKAPIPFRNGPRKFLSTKPSPVRASFATENSAWKSASPNSKSSDSSSLSA